MSSKTYKGHVGIIGAGMTGMSSAKHLLEKGYEVTILEAEDYVGGLAKDCSKNGFVVDLGPHYVFETLAKKVGLDPSESSRFPYYEELFYAGKFYTFPFGMMKNIRFALSVGSAYFFNLFRKKDTSTLHKALMSNYGKPFTREILAPLLSKWAGKHPKDLSLDLSKRLEPANLDQILFFVKKVVFRVSPDYKDQSRHWVYPHKGVGALFEKLKNLPGMNIHLSEPVKKIKVKENKVSEIVTHKNTYTFDHVVSTLPINQLNKICEGTDVFKSHEALEFRAVMFYFIRYKKPQILKKLWTWFPQDKYVFYRISEPKNVLEHLGPKDETQLTVEVACNYGDDIWNADQDELKDKIHAEICEAYGVKDEDFMDFYVEKARYVYPIFDRHQDDIRDSIKFQSPLDNMVWGGRVGQFKYIFLEECFGIGKKCAETIDKKYNS